MEKEVVEFVYKCFISKKVKSEYGKYGGLFWFLKVSGWKWDSVMMDFV